MLSKILSFFPEREENQQQIKNYKNINEQTVNAFQTQLDDKKLKHRPLYRAVDGLDERMKDPALQEDLDDWVLGDKAALLATELRRPNLKQVINSYQKELNLSRNVEKNNSIYRQNSLEELSYQEPELMRAAGHNTPLLIQRFQPKEYEQMSKTLGNLDPKVARTFFQNTKEILDWVPHDILNESLQMINDTYNDFNNNPKKQDALLKTYLGDALKLRNNIFKENKTNAPEKFRASIVDRLETYE